MKDNIYDKVLEKTLKRVEMASDRIAKQFKNVKPFDKEPIPKKELLDYYEMLTAEDMQYLVQQHGEDVINGFIADMEQYKWRYQNA